MALGASLASLREERVCCAECSLGRAALSMLSTTVLENRKKPDGIAPVGLPPGPYLKELVRVRILN